MLAQNTISRTASCRDPKLADKVTVPPTKTWLINESWVLINYNSNPPLIEKLVRQVNEEMKAEDW